MSNAMNKDGAIAPLTNQQVFDFALLGLRKQGTKGMGAANGMCAYRTAEGNACGVGQSIPDSINVHTIDNWGDSSITLVMETGQPSIDVINFQTMFSDCNVKMLADLQKLHDIADSINSVWEEGMQAIAKESGLVYTPV